MHINIGYAAFAVTPAILAAVLMWRWPSYRRIRLRPIATYLIVVGLVIYGALLFVARAASAKVPPTEVLVVLWFIIAWRLAWIVWQRTVGRLGERWRRWARIRRRQGQPTSFAIRLIAPARMLLTLGVFFPVFLTCVLTHRCKLHDGQNPQSIFAVPYEHVRIPTADGLTLDGWFIPERNADRTIIICHGAGANKGNFVWFLAPILYKGYNVLFFDFRAHGASDGRTTTYGIRERLDVIAAVDWLKRERPGYSHTIVGLGSSQGSMALAVAAADDSRIDAVVLDSPFVSPRELVRPRAAVVPGVGPVFVDWALTLMSIQTGTNFFSASAERAVAALGQRPLLVIHGDDDIGMPASHSQRLYDAATGPRDIWFGPGPHSNIVTTVPEEYGERLFTFLDASLPTSK